MDFALGFAASSLRVTVHRGIDLGAPPFSFDLGRYGLALLSAAGRDRNQHRKFGAAICARDVACAADVFEQVNVTIGEALRIRGQRDRSAFGRFGGHGHMRGIQHLGLDQVGERGLGHFGGFTELCFAFGLVGQRLDRGFGAHIHRLLKLELVVHLCEVQSAGLSLKGPGRRELHTAGRDCLAMKGVPPPAQTYPRFRCEQNRNRIGRILVSAPLLFNRFAARRGRTGRKCLCYIAANIIFARCFWGVGICFRIRRGRLHHGQHQDGDQPQRAYG